MTTIAKPLIESKNCESAITTQYTTPVSTRAQVDKFTATNTTVGAITIDVHLVPSGGTASAANRIISAKSIAAGADESLSALAGHTLDAGGFIAAGASATGLTIRCSGRETS